MSGFVPSSPYLFRPLKRALLGGVALLLLLSWSFPAPLEIAADPAHPPNPAKSAWFLLCIQELVSHDTRAILAAVALAVLLVALPWLPVRPVEQASWFPRPQRPLAALVLLISCVLVALTATGLLFRGPDWRLVFPF